MNIRRKIIVALGASVLTAPLASFAQQQTKIWRVGILALRDRPASGDSEYFAAFPQRMRELGYVEKKNLEIEWRFADGDVDKLESLAAELARSRVDVIVASGNQAVGAAQKATPAIPIVMGNVDDPVGGGLVASLARPGRNTTGLSTVASDISAKYLELVRDMVPRLSRVAVFTNPDSPTQVNIRKNIEAAAKNTGIAIVSVEVRTAREIESAFAAIIKAKAQALIFASNPLFMQQRRQMAELAAKYRLPFISSYREYAEVGALMSYGPSISDLYRHVATFVDKILKGAKAGEIPVEQPTKFELIINGKTAKALGLKIPQSLLIMADKVIE